MNNKTNRIFSYDIIRILATLAVVMIHASSDTVKGAPTGSADFIIANILDSISRIGVPLFVMLSGALMLNESREIPIKKIFKTAGSFFVLLLIWSVAYAAVYQIVIPILSGNDVSIKNFIYKSIFGHTHLWYLYMLVGLYLLLPILRLFVKKENSNYVLYFILLAMVFKFSVPLASFAFDKVAGGFVTSENLISAYADQFYLDVLGEYITYYLIGWYISNVDIKKNIRLALYILGAAGMITTVLGPQIFSTDTSRPLGLFYANSSINVLLYSVGVFLFIFYLFKEKDGGMTSPVITKLSGLTFGTYLIHMMLLTLISKAINIGNLIVEMPVEWLICVVASFGASYVMSKIPIVKKLIKC